MKRFSASRMHRNRMKKSAMIMTQGTKKDKCAMYTWIGTGNIKKSFIGGSLVSFNSILFLCLVIFNEQWWLAIFGILRYPSKLYNLKRI